MKDKARAIRAMHAGRIIGSPCKGIDGSMDGISGDILVQPSQERLGAGWG